MRLGVRHLLAVSILFVSCGFASYGQGCCYIEADPSAQAEPYSAFPASPGSLWHYLDRIDYWAVPLTPPLCYYDSVDDTSADSLRDTLHELVDGHCVQPYDDSESEGMWPALGDDTVDAWDIVALADAHPSIQGYVLGLYTNREFMAQSKGASSGDVYDREHSWPKSYGFKAERTENPAYSDCHHLFAALKSYNSSRGQCPYGAPVTEAVSLKPTETNLGCGGGSEEANLRFSRSVGGSTRCLWATWCGRRGDVARAMFYMAIRYEGGTDCRDCDGKYTFEPNLELANDLRLIVTCDDAWLDGCVASMGLLSDLLQWHKQDPPDDFERRRNTVVYLFQGNRNPFVDHPEWVEAIFGPAGG